MKKIFFLICILSLSVFTFAQTIPTGNNIQTGPSTSVSAFQVETKKYSLNITIENGSIIKNLTLKPNENYLNMYLNSNWGTLDKKITFTTDVNLQTVSFIFARRVVKVGEVYKLYKEGIPCMNFEEFSEAKIFNDVKTIKLSCIAEFTTPNGETIKKDLEINFEKNSSETGDEVFATAKINNKDLGLNVLTLKVQSPIGFPFSLQNKEYDLSLVVKASDKGDIQCLASKIMPDGVYPFVCRIGLPNGIAVQETIEAFVKDGEIILDQSSFNPLSFADGNATFSGKKTLVKMTNTRNEDIIIFIPEDYIAKGKSLSVDFNSNTFGSTIKWKSYVISPGKTLKLMLKTSSIKTLVYSYTNKKAEILELGLSDRPTQKKYLRWGRWSSN